MLKHATETAAAEGMNEMPNETRRLPFTVRPATMETIASYAARLQRANDITRTTWRAWLNAELGTKTPTDATLEPFVETVAGLRSGHFARQTELVPAHSDGVACGNCTTGLQERFACVRCTFGEVVPQLDHDGARVCRKHRRWVGPGVGAHEQFTVGRAAVKADRTYARLKRAGRLDAHRLAELTACVDMWVAAEVTVTLNAAERFDVAVSLGRALTGPVWSREGASRDDTSEARYALLTAEVDEVVGHKSCVVLVDSLWMLLRGAGHADNNGHHSFEVTQSTAAPDPAWSQQMRTSAYPRSRHLHLAQYLSSDTPGTCSQRWDTQHTVSRYNCERGHRFDVKPAQFTKAVGSGCVYCANRRPLIGFNTLLDTHPKLAAEWHPTENGDRRPTDLVAGSPVVVAWLCAAGHTFRTSPNDRAGRNVGCGYCANWLVDSDTNSLAVTRPDVAAQWHSTLNGELTPRDVVAGSERRAWFTCAAGHDFHQTIARRSEGRQCPYCCRRLAHPTTCLAVTHPDVAALWHHSKNGDLTTRDVLAGSTRRVWWRCPENPDHDHVTSVANRASGFGCGYCAGRLVNTTNSMRTTHPHLAAEFHPTKNGDNSPDNVTANSSKRYWWRCAEGHEWAAVGYSRVRYNNRCPFCSNRRVWVGWNDMATTHPEFAAEWHRTKNGELRPERVVAGTNKAIWWNCGCGYEWRATGNHRVFGGRCPRCRGAS